MLKSLARAGNKDFRGTPSDEEESAGEGGPDNLSVSLHFTKLHKEEKVYNIKKQYGRKEKNCQNKTPTLMLSYMKW